VRERPQSEVTGRPEPRAVRFVAPDRTQHRDGQDPGVPVAARMCRSPLTCGSFTPDPGHHQVARTPPAASTKARSGTARFCCHPAAKKTKARPPSVAIGRRRCLTPSRLVSLASALAGHAVDQRQRSFSGKSSNCCRLHTYTLPPGSARQRVQVAPTGGCHDSVRLAAITSASAPALLAQGGAM